MVCRVSWKVILVPRALLAFLAFAWPSQASAAEPPQDQSLVVDSGAGKTLTLSPTEFARLPRTTRRVKLPHSEAMATYEGVLLYRLLQEAGACFEHPSSPQTISRILPGALRTSYVLIEAADGYRVVFSVAEIHPDLGGKDVLLADRVDGQPLGDRAAPFQVIAAASQLYGRWIRQVTRVVIQPAAHRTGEPKAPATSEKSLLVVNEAGTTIRLTPAEFAKLPRTVIRDKVPPHEDVTASYEGVLLHELLQKAGVKFDDRAAAEGEPRVPAALRTAYVSIEAADGDQVVFSIPEVHPDLGGRRVLVADRVDGQPLAEDARPYRVIVAGSNLYEVWIGQVTAVCVRHATESVRTESE
ncbi:MAG: hypothetical protein FJ276_14115 [Planctomycetes bacterium]|nr:hypothetical protein [Planctomycetota bacterium]